jgi:DNA-binding transcriptional regulator PaaX
MVMEARCVQGYSNKAIVAGTWDFAEINGRYRSCLNLLTTDLRKALNEQAPKETVLDWLRRERLAWLRALRVDPLLPHALLPDDYLGQKAWKARQEALALVSRCNIISMP